MTNLEFTHLHVHTSLGSMMDAMTNVYDLFKRAAELGQKSLAITDHGTQAATWDARKASLKYGVKYIPGCEFYFVDDVNGEKEKRKHIVLLASNEKGYRNLLRLNYQGYLHNEYVPVLGKVFPRIDWKMLEQFNDGIICLTACGSGLVSKQMFVHGEDGEWLETSCHNNVLNTVNRLKIIFGDNLYLEVQPHNLRVLKRSRKTGEIELGKNGKEEVIVDQNHINKKLFEVGKQLGIKLVATADIHYLNKEDAAIHDMLMAISNKAPLSDKLRHRYEVEEFYMKNADQVAGHFNGIFGEDFAKELCANSMEIAGKCEEPVYLDVKETRFPKFDTKSEKDYEDFLKWRDKNKAGIPEDHAFLRYRCILGFKNIYGHLRGEDKKLYVKRMMEEIKVLELHNFCSYMLIVSDFINKAKQNGIPVGPGRGSVGGSLVGQLLGIHMVDPIKYGLLFERFHNKEKKAFPDIDTDISPDGREWVINYITEKYGKEKVAHVSNLSRMTPKVIITDIARSLELGGTKSKAFEIAKHITNTIPDTAKTFDEVMNQSKEFRKYCEQYPQLETYGRKLVGLEKAYATHAAGVVIGDIDLSTYVPLRVDKNGDVSIQYEKNRCEEMGLIKMDLLGLEHLRIIKNTINNARKLGMTCLDPENVPLDDKNVWSDLAKGKTLCIFQMESGHMKTLCKQIKPQSIEDLSLVNALGRPSAGQKGKNGEPAPRDTYIARRDGREKVEFKYECLRAPLEETLGICVYEEQMAKLANSVAGWDLNKADGLRKLTKLKEKGKELAAKLKDEFISDGIKYSKLKKDEATDIWENIIEPFSGYGFNKAHGILYSVNGYHTAYYKHYFPVAFMAAVLQAETDKASSPSKDSNIREYKKESKRMGIDILTPDINKSLASFAVINNNTIITGLEAVKGVGASAVKNILEVREKHIFKSFADFLYRTKSSVVKKDVIQALAQAGCFDSLNITRKTAFTYYSDIRTKSNKYASSVENMGYSDWDRLNDFSFSKPDFDDEWSIKDKLQAEMNTLGEYVSGTINDLYGGFFTGKGTTILSKLKTLPEGFTIRVETIISDVKQDKLKKGPNKGRVYAKFTLTDINNDSAQLTAWPEQWVKYKDTLTVGKAIRAVCRVNIWNGNNTLVLDRLENVNVGVGNAL